jgi:hypothetical protein
MGVAGFDRDAESVSNLKKGSAHVPIGLAIKYITALSVLMIVIGKC